MRGRAQARPVRWRSSSTRARLENVIQLERGMATKQTVQLLMPEMGESVTEGTVLEWHVSEGDSVEEGQTMVEVSTDKVDAEVPAPASGTITKLLVATDEVVQVDQALAEMTPGEAPSGEGKRSEDGAGAEAGSPPAAPALAEEEPAGGDSTAGGQSTPP